MGLARGRERRGHRRSGHALPHRGAPLRAQGWRPGRGAPARNTVEPSRGGSLILRGNLELLRPDGTLLLRDTRVALCRCGQSRNRPFCDNSHRDVGFADRGEVFEGGLKPGDAGSADPRLRITPIADGPLLLAGPVTIRSTDGRVALQGGKASLCRCGRSRNKPFCDGSHKGAGFVTG